MLIGKALCAGLYWSRASGTECSGRMNEGEAGRLHSWHTLLPLLQDDDALTQ